MSHNASDFRSPLKRVRGFGSGHSGTEHFWLQRVTALALVPLSVWFLVQLITSLLGGDRATLAHWLADPISALLLGVFLLALFVHARLGIQTIIEDYVHCDCMKIGLLLAHNAINLLLCAGSVIAVAHLHFVGI